MYKYRLKKWDLDKKYKEREVIQMSLIKQQRKSVGKRTIFFIRGKQVDWDQVERYLYRRPDLQTKIKAGMLKMSSSNFGIACRSPSPNPILHASSTLQYTDELIRLLNGYYSSGLNGALRRSIVDQAGDSSVAIRCYRRLDQARAMIGVNLMKLGFQALNGSLDDLRFIVKDQDATLIFYLCDFATTFDQQHKALVIELLRYTHDMLLVTFGDAHPLVWLLNRLVRVSNHDRYEVIAKILEATVDNFSRLGISGRLKERVNCHYALLLDSMGIKGITAEGSFPELDMDSLDATSMAYIGRLADRLIFSRNFEASDRKSDGMLPWLQNPLNQQHSSWADLQLVFYYVKAHGAFQRGDCKAGEAGLDLIEKHIAQYFRNL